MYTVPSINSRELDVKAIGRVRIIIPQGGATTVTVHIGHT